MKNQTKTNIDWIQPIFNFLMNKYGFEKVTEKKFQ